MSLTENPFFQAVKTHADCLLAFGRDPVEDDPGPLFAGVIDALDHTVTLHLMVPPPGIRVNDVSALGNNLMHDVPFLETLLALTRLTGEPAYARAVDAVFDYYPKHCPYPATGLFPWGEHAQWSFKGKRVMPNFVCDPIYFAETNAIIHEHLRFAPAWFWERMWASGPEAVVRFAHGLDRHLMNKDTFEHNRHAPLTEHVWNEMPYTGQGKDFARHAGFFIFDCLFAFRKSGDRGLLDWARRKTAYHMKHRLPGGIVRGCIRTPGYEGEGQHDSLAMSLHDAAQALGLETPEGAEFLAIAEELFGARRKQHEGKQAQPFEEELPPAAAWNCGYGAATPRAVSTGMPAQMWVRTGAQWYADTLCHAADWQMAVPPPPADRPVVTHALLVNLKAQLNAYAVSGEKRYLDRAEEVARWGIERFAPTGLFLGAINMDYYFNINIAWSVRGCFGKSSPRPGYYFSGLGVPELQRELLRLALFQEGEDDFLGISSHYR